MTKNTAEDRSHLEMLWESLTKPQQAAVMHSVNQQAERALISVVGAVPENLQATVRKSVDEATLVENTKFGILKALFESEAYISSYEADYRQHLQASGHLKSSNESPEVSGGVRSVVGGSRRA